MSSLQWHKFAWGSVSLPSSPEQLWNYWGGGADCQLYLEKLSLDFAWGQTSWSTATLEAGLPWSVPVWPLLITRDCVWCFDIKLMRCSNENLYCVALWVRPHFRFHVCFGLSGHSSLFQLSDVTFSVFHCCLKFILPPPFLRAFWEG